MTIHQEMQLSIAHAHDSIKIILGLKKLIHIINFQKDDYITQISTIIDTIERHLSLTSDLGNLDNWKLNLIGLQLLRSHLQCRNIAQGKPGDIISERERLTVLCEELHFVSSSIQFEVPISDVFSQIVKQDGRSININKLLEFLCLLPIATTYFKEEAISLSLLEDLSNNDNEQQSPLVRLTAFIDRSPLVSPQLLKSQLSYSLNFKIRGVVWHKESEKLHLRLFSTYPTADYTVSPFILQKPTNIENYDYQGELNGQIQFRVAQSILSDNIFFSIECTFELSDGSFQGVPIIGCNQFEFRVDDPSNPLSNSGYSRLDLHVAQLLRSLLQNNPNIQDEMEELLPVLESLTCLLGSYAQGAVFKETDTMSEANFQKEILRDLRPKLGQDVKEHTGQSGGFVDICYRGVIIELKVERTNGDRQHICQTYTKQSAQYEGVESRQVSIVLVLDLTPKDNPLGDNRDNIFLVDVPTHRGDDTTKKYPSKAFVFIVNGNIKSPSDYSKPTKKPKK